MSKTRNCTHAQYTVKQNNNNKNKEEKKRRANNNNFQEASPNRIRSLIKVLNSVLSNPRLYIKSQKKLATKFENHFIQVKKFLSI
jgi:hypothetical protein